jgi:Transglycosylase SLT domain
MGRFARRARAALAPGSRLPGSARAAARRRSLRSAPVLPVALAGILGLGVLGLGGQALFRGPPGAAAQPARMAQAATALPADQRAITGADSGSQAEALDQAPASASASAAAAAQARGLSFGRIILPDLLIVAPRGLTRQQETRLAAISGVRNMISFDGARITVGGKPVNAIGVNPATFRSWVPVRTASDQAIWTALGQGEFVAATSVATKLSLRAGASYRLSGAGADKLRFGSPARLAMNGVDLLVNQGLSARLGLVHQVAALISAPGVALPALTRAVSAILGPSAQTESLRGQQLAPSATGPAAPNPGGTSAGGTSAGGTAAGGTGSAGTRGAASAGPPTTYLQLFQESAARYCPGLSWTVLAAIGQIESADGTNVGPSSAGALGPMQFLPSTWATWGVDGFGQTGPPDVLNPYDAVPAAARMLCADGAARGGAALSAAVFDYNHADWYVREVLQLAAAYAREFPQ